MNIFNILLLAGLAFLALSFLTGGHDHDLGGGHDFHADHDGGDGEQSNIFSHILSIRNLALFVFGFGAAGSLVIHYGGSDLEASLAGLALGVVMVMIGIWIFRTIAKQQGNSLSSGHFLIGKTGNVVCRIGEGSLGEITTSNEYGAPRTLAATSHDGTTIEEGARVEIVSVTGNTATVKATA